MRRLRNARWSLRRWWFVTVLRLQAAAKGARLTLDVAPDVRLGSRIKISLDKGSVATLRLGPGVALHDDILVHLRRGSVDLGPRCSVRRGTVLNISGGDLVLEGDNILSYYNTIHCADFVRFGQFSSTNEFVTIVDSKHFHTDDGKFFYENTVAGGITIGRNAWIASKSTVLMGVTVGDEAIVAAHAVVHGDVPRRAVAGGIPAKVIQQR